MKPHELIARLVHEAGGSQPVAKAMQHPTFQGTLNKICNGHVASPKRETALRIAQHFGIPVDALYDSQLAEQIYVARFGSSVVARAPGATYRPRPPRARLSQEAEEFARWYDALSPEDQHKARLMMWVVKPGVNPSNFPAPGPDHVDEPDSGLSNLDPPNPKG